MWRQGQLDAGREVVCELHEFKSVAIARKASDEELCMFGQNARIPRST